MGMRTNKKTLNSSDQHEAPSPYQTKRFLGALACQSAFCDGDVDSLIQWAMSLLHLLARRQYEYERRAPLAPAVRKNASALPCYDAFADG